MDVCTKTGYIINSYLIKHQLFIISIIVDITVQNKRSTLRNTNTNFIISICNNEPKKSSTETYYGSINNRRHEHSGPFLNQWTCMKKVPYNYLWYASLLFSDWKLLTDAALLEKNLVKPYRNNTALESSNAFTSTSLLFFLSYPWLGL